MHVLQISGLILTVVSMVSCGTKSSSSQKSVDDIAAVTNSNGRITVVCKNAATYEYTSAEFRQKVADNSICNGGGTSMKDYICIAYNATTSQIAKISDSKPFGSNVPHDICKAAIQSSRYGLICVPYNGATVQVYHGASGKYLGTNVAFDACNNIVQNSRTDLTCAPYNATTSQVAKIQTGTFLGTNVDHAICSKIINAARGDLVCIPYNATTSQLGHISTGQTIGSNVNHDICIGSIPAQ